MRKKAVFLSAALLFFCSIGLAQEDSDFKVPAPPESQLIEGSLQTFTLGDKSIKGAEYQSKEKQEAIIKYYRGFFKDEGFIALEDGYLYQQKEMSLRRLRFKREDLAIDIFLSSNAEGARVGVAQYLQPKGSPDLEHTLPSVQDAQLISLPKEDMPGEDLAAIPRPPKSTRWISEELGKQTHLSYITPLSVNETKEFYKAQMVVKGWEMEKELAAADAMDSYKKETGEKDLKLPAIFSGGEDLTNVVTESYFLDFQASFGRASLTIIPNFVDKKLGSLVDILYEEKE